MKALLEKVDDVLATRTRPSEALAILRDTAALPHILELIRADPARLIVAARASYRHRNGFDKIVLAAPPGSQLKLVLHLWRQDEVVGRDHIHNHRWDFASVVLLGALQLELYKRDAEGATYIRMKYRKARSLNDGTRYRLEPCGTMPVSAAASAILTVGSTYTWSARLLHRAWALPGTTTATLIVQGPPVRNRTSVLVDDESQAIVRHESSALRGLHVNDIDQTLAELATSSVATVWRRDISDRGPSRRISHFDGFCDARQVASK